MLQVKGQDDLKRRVDDLAKSINTDLTEKVVRALRVVCTLAGKSRDPCLILDALDDLIAAATRAQLEDAKIDFYKKVADQARKMDHLPSEDFGSLCLCLLGDNVDQKIAEGMARFNKMRGKVGGEKAGAKPAQAAPPSPSQGFQGPPQPFGAQYPPAYAAPWQYQSPIPTYPPMQQGGYGQARRGRGRGRGGFSKSRACYFCKQEGHFMENCAELKALKSQQS